MPGLSLLDYSSRPNHLTKTVALKCVNTTPFEKSLSMVPPALTRHLVGEGSTALDTLKFPNIFESTTASLRTRYTPADWTANNMSNFSLADCNRSDSERIRNDSLRLIGATYDRTSMAQRESSTRLGERMNDISFWRRELIQENDKLIVETNRLNDSKNLLAQALADTERPFHVTKECVFFRENRQEIDLVRDKVEGNLLRELDLIKDCQSRMKNLLESVNMQLNRNRSARQQLEHDIQNKNSAINIDSTMHTFHNNSAHITYYPGIERVDTTISVPETWCDLSNKNVEQSQRERAQSQRLRAEVESLLSTTHQDMWSSWSCTNSSLNHRASEINDTKNRLTLHREKVQQEINDLERQIAGLKKAILDKTGPLKVVQSRLEGRTHRPENELCRDEPQHRMVREVQELSDTLDALRHKLQEAEDSLYRLAQTRAKIDHDLSIKTNSLYIDQEKCLGIRRSFPLMQPHLVDFALY